MNDVSAELTKFVELTDDALKPFVPENDETAFQQAITLARQQLAKAGLIENTKEDFVKITSLGKQVLHRRLNSIDTHYLKRFPGYEET